MQEFVSEGDLKTFEGWLRYQAIDAATASPEDLEAWRRCFEDARERAAAAGKVGLMKLQPVPGEYRYAVAVEDGGDLWLALWVRRSPKGEFFVLLPRGDRDWNPHTSYHLDGTMHLKSYGGKALSKKCQPLTGTFRGTEDLGFHAGYGPKSVGAMCDPGAFSGIVRVASGVLGPKHGWVKVDLVEPCHQPTQFPGLVTQQVFRHIIPWVVITVGS